MRSWVFEIRRALWNGRFFVALGAGALLVLLHVGLEVLPLQRGLSLIGTPKGEDLYPLSLYQYWLGLSGSVYSSVFYMALPLLAAFPFADSFTADRHSGFVNQIVLRRPKAEYLAAKAGAVFVSAFLVTAVPLLLDLLLSATVLPAVPPQASTWLFPLTEHSMLSGLYYSAPLLYVLLYILIDAVFMGLFVSVSLTLANLVSNRLELLATPFVVYLVLYLVTTWFSVANWSPYGLLVPSQPVRGVRPEILFAEVGLLLATQVGFYYYGNRKRDVL